MLNRFLGAPLQAGEALLTSMKPRWLLTYYFNIVNWTDFQADSTIITFIIHPEILIHFVDLPKRHLIEPGKKDILPEGSPLYLFLLTLKDRTGNHLHLFLGFLEKSLLSFNWSRTAPGSVIGRHDNGIA